MFNRIFELLRFWWTYRQMRATKNKIDNFFLQEEVIASRPT